jgi:uncharacterized protein (DUF1697 family)
MTMYVALLRGVNVGKHHRVSMAAVRDTLAQAGFAGVTTHIQTGNLLLESRRRGPAAIGRSIEDALRKGLDIDVDVIVRTAAELSELARANPFLARGADPATLHVAFLKTRPPADAARQVTDVRFGDDEFELRGEEIYLRYAHGLGRSKMNPAFFERVLRTPATVRNWNVVTRLLELASHSKPAA